MRRKGIGEERRPPLWATHFCEAEEDATELLGADTQLSWRFLRNTPHRRHRNTALREDRTVEKKCVRNLGPKNPKRHQTRRRRGPPN